VRKFLELSIFINVVGYDLLELANRLAGGLLSEICVIVF
jgi:hypothetical protein